MKQVYICDPKKNKKCTKESCWINGGPCRYTTRKKCRKPGSVGLSAETWCRKFEAAQCQHRTSAEDLRNNSMIVEGLGLSPLE